MTHETHHFDAPCGVTFKVVLSSSTYSVAAFDRTGARIAWSGRKWGPSLTDALGMAAYTGQPERATSAVSYLFARIDGFKDSPGICDLWARARYRGETGAAKHARLQPYRDAMKRAHDARFGRDWSGLYAHAQILGAQLGAVA